MPKIFEYFGYIFFFYSNEHEPIHVHVNKGDKESVFELIVFNGDLVEVRQRDNDNRNSLSEKDCKTAMEFITKYSANIIEKWINFFVLKKRIKSTNIKTKI